MKLRKFKLGIFLIMFLICSISVEASNCQLQVSLGKEADQVELSIYKIAEAEENGYECLSDYNEIDLELMQLKKANDIKDASRKVYAWIKDQNISADKKGQTNDDGQVVFSVDCGAYLIAKESKEGEMAPVLVMIPNEYDSQTFQAAPKYSKSEESVNNKQDAVTTETKVEDASTGEGAASGQGTATGEGVSTGDSASLMLWGGIMMIAVIIVILLGKNKKEYRIKRWKD